MPPPAEDELVETLKSSLPELFAAKGGRNPRVEIEILRDRIDLKHDSNALPYNILIYVEGPVSSLLVFGAEGLRTDHICPALRCGIAYDPKDGRLEVIMTGGKGLRTQIASVAASILGHGSTAEPIVLREFDLSSLKKSSIFAFDATDPIREVWLEEIEIHSITDGQPRLVFKRPKRRGAVDPKWTQHSGVFGKPCEAIEHNLVSIRRAVIGVRFHPESGERQAKTVLTSITVPNRCNLRDQTDRERLILQKYLPRWGLVKGLPVPVKHAA